MSNFVALNSIPYVDELVHEYLFFRGFTKTLATLKKEQQNDKLFAFSVGKLVDKLLAYVFAYEYPKLLYLWDYLNKQYFKHLSPAFFKVLLKLESNLKKFYLINAFLNGKADKLFEFFKISGSDLLHHGKDWEKWFTLPYIIDLATNRKDGTKPAEMRSVYKQILIESSYEDFAPFTSKSYINNLTASLFNFLSNLFQSIALPKILNFNANRLEMKRKDAELAYLKNENATLKRQLEHLTDQLDSAKRSKGELLRTVKVTQDEEAKIKQMQVAARKVRLIDKRLVSAPLSPVPLSKRHSTSASSLHEKHSVETGSLHEKETRTSPPTPASASPKRKNSNSGRFFEDIRSSIVSDKHEVQGSEVYSGQSTVQGEEEQPDEEAKRSAASSVAILLGRSVYSGHSASVSQVLFSRKGDCIASGSTHGTVRVWTLDKNSTIKPSRFFCFSEILSLKWMSQNSRVLLCGTADGRVDLWNTTTEKKIGKLHTTEWYPRVMDIACSPTDNTVVTASVTHDCSKGCLEVWDMKTLQRKKKIDLENNPAITSIQINHNGQMLTAASLDGSIRMLDTANYTSLMHWRGDKTNVPCVRLNRGETSLFSLGTEGKIFEWSLMHKEGKPKGIYHWPSYSESNLAFDSTGDYFVVGGGDNCSYIYQVGNEKYLRRLTGHEKPVVTVDWHPVDNVVVTGSLDAKVSAYSFAKQIG